MTQERYSIPSFLSSVQQYRLTNSISVLFVLFVIQLFFISPVKAQEIDFGDFSSKYAVTVSELIPAEDLSFGMVIQNEGLKSIDILNSKVMMIIESEEATRSNYSTGNDRYHRAVWQRTFVPNNINKPY